jgi:hypothetical protein
MKQSLPAAAAVFLLLLSAPVQALPADAGLSLSRAGTGSPSASSVRFTAPDVRDFRRCMRAKYGPRYFYRIRQAQRYFMAQACGG